MTRFRGIIAFRRPPTHSLAVVQDKPVVSRHRRALAPDLRASSLRASMQPVRLRRSGDPSSSTSGASGDLIDSGSLMISPSLKLVHLPRRSGAVNTTSAVSPSTSDHVASARCFIDLTAVRHLHRRPSPGDCGGNRRRSASCYGSLQVILRQLRKPASFAASCVFDSAR